MHDAFCPMRPSPGLENYVFPGLPSACYCSLISMVRADERNRITAERVERFGVWHDYDPLEGGH